MFTVGNDVQSGFKFLHDLDREMGVLFDLRSDPGETRNLADEKPEVLKRLIAAWERRAEDVGVVLTDQ